MSIARLIILILILALALCSGCGESEKKHQTLIGKPDQPDAGGNRYVVVPEGGGLGDLTPLSELLGCGQPCSDYDVDESGACTKGIAVRCEAGTVACGDCAAGGRACIAASDNSPVVCRRDDCEGVEICPKGSECYTKQCCSNTRWCEHGVQVICDEDGRYTTKQPCLEGLDCIDGQCVPARPTVLVLFDTSGSMSWTPKGDKPDPSAVIWPACDDVSAPQTRLGISKSAFHTLFSDGTYQHVLFALQRFPQHLDPALGPLCPSGAYSSQDLITGHIGKWAIADDTSGDWFVRNLAEVLLVPFPSSTDASNRAELKSWLDFQEETSLTDTPCTAHSDCPGGLCTHPGGVGTCRYLDNPELRAIGWTPLGQSLFYSGEYLRKFVVVDGRGCQLDGDCRSPTYFCEDGTCVDPNRFCRQRSIVVFSDGADTASLGSWLDPIVQAKRFRGGLDCTINAHCGAGFECIPSGTCQPVGAHESGNPCESVDGVCSLEERTFPEAVTQGADRLRDGLGRAIHLVVHVVDASGGHAGDTAAIAAYGGGLLVPADLASPTALLSGIKGVIDWKDANFCDTLAN